ncbi:hypothetical protein AV530_000641 [Patagioenas fasciata monilis]|uniref:Uncharacterized protein n=1 Tax=Patagioenas fasciata monilis TaxID=372326 RepID=A0A1V4IGV4_PATFA|nr:hypothetical protein AV530_000641 [Patagioenas fasciata monilis]
MLEREQIHKVHKGALALTWKDRPGLWETRFCWFGQLGFVIWPVFNKTQSKGVKFRAGLQDIGTSVSTDERMADSEAAALKRAFHSLAGCEFLRKSICEQMRVFERQLDIEEMSNAQMWLSCLSPNGVDENRRSRWWHGPVLAADTALELCVVQKASPCGEADSAPAKYQCGGFYGGFLQLRDVCEFPGHVTSLTLVESLRSSRRVLKKRSSPVQVPLGPSPSRRALLGSSEWTWAAEAPERVQVVKHWLP